MLQWAAGTVKKTMGWYGKLIGTILGYIIGRGWVGAIVGFLIGHQFDVATRSKRRPTASAIELSAAFFRATFQAMGHVAKADGRVTEREIDAARQAMRRFALNEAQVRMAIELFTEGKRSEFPLDETIRHLRDLARGRPDLSRMFVQIQLEAALFGGGLGPAPRAVLVRISDMLRVSPLEFASFEAMLRMQGARAGHAGREYARADNGRGSASADRLADAYAVLGVRASASDAEVTKAYRRLVSQNHPDKLVANGLPESMVAAAHERTQRILEAYEIIRSHRGIK
jgi:DnaJ like chaperone protein